MNTYYKIVLFVGILYHCACSVLPTNQITKPIAKPNRTIDKYYLKEQSSYHYLLAELSVLENKLDQSLLEIKNAQLYDSVDLNLKIREIEMLLVEGHLYKALSWLDNLLQSQAKQADLLELKAKIFELSKSYASAEQIYKQLPKTDKVKLAQIRLAFLQKHFTKTIFLAKKARFKQDSFFIEAQYYLAQSFEQKKQFIKAEKVYTKTLKKHLQVEAFLLFGLAKLYALQKKTNKEIQVLLKYKDRLSEPYLVLQRLFVIYIIKKDNSKALEQAKNLLDAGIKDIDFQFQVSLLYIEAQKYQQASALLKQVLLLDPSLDRAQFYLGLSYQKLGELQNAKNIFSKIKVSSSYYIDAIESNYYLLKQEKKFSLITTMLIKALKQKTLSVKIQKQLHYLLILHYQDQQGFAKAIAYAQKTVELLPNFVNGLNYISYQWTVSNRYIKKAEILALKAHKLAPNNAFVMDTLGLILFKKGDYKQAKNYLELAYSKYPSLETAEHLGDVYKYFNKKSQANKLYSQAFSFAKNNLDKIRLKNKIRLLLLNKKVKKAFKAKNLIKNRKPSFAKPLK